MGTRSLIYFKETSGEAVACIYQQFDGYPSCVGLELAKFLTGITIINGISGGQDVLGKFGKFANGMGCLAAQFIATQKNRVGGLYMISTEEPQDAGQDYEYHVYPDKVVVRDYDSQIFSGDHEQFLAFCKKAD